MRKTTNPISSALNIDPSRIRSGDYTARFIAEHGFADSGTGDRLSFVANPQSRLWRGTA
jgi:hypothetical protein